MRALKLIITAAALLVLAQVGESRNPHGGATAASGSIQNLQTSSGVLLQTDAAVQLQTS